jgi:cytochrome c-type biogenesis protein
MESFFFTINAWMTSGSAIAVVGCFLWGMVSVLLSPCHLASIPLIVAYVGGQEKALHPRQAGLYAMAFTGGLAVTIASVGIICAWMGRMLGDVGNYWQVGVGGILIWVALGMMGVEKCTVSGSLLYRLNLKGLFGAFGLGLAYGILSGSCTFGFIAPILAIVTIQQKVAVGILFILLFTIGHCLPIAVAGSFAAVIRKLMENSVWQGAGVLFRKGAGIMIIFLGCYFMFNPFVAN